jgi:plasmid stabilization system protein ParE
MCSNDSPSEIADGTTDAATLADEYEQFRLDLEGQPLPSYRAEELRVRIEAVRQTLATDGVASAGQLQRLLRVVTEALADVRGAGVVASPVNRDLTDAVPGDSGLGACYDVTPDERQETLDLLVNLLFTVVETPTSDDAGGDASDPRDADAVVEIGGSESATTDTDTETTNGFGMEGYAGPE